MNPLLAINIGNTNIQVGIFENSTLAASWRVHSEIDKTADEYSILLGEFFGPASKRVPSSLDQSENLDRTSAACSPDEDSSRSPAKPAWRGAILVSVVPPLTPTILQLCREHFLLDPIVVNSTLKFGMPIRYENPRALGADRIVSAVAAKEKYGAPVLVVDFGTATTFNAINRAGEFAGGAIAPGVNLAAAALVRGTAQLPQIELAVPPHVIGTNTVHAMQSGILNGYAGLIEGMIERLRVELGEANAPVVATGGRAGLIARQVPGIDAVDPNLILEGLRVIDELNRR